MLANRLSGSYLGQITSGKRMGTQNGKCPNRDIKSLKSWNNWSRLNLFKATEVERKMRETNLLINMQINLSLCRTSHHYFLLFLQWLSWDLLGTKNASSMYAANHGGRKDVAEITCVCCPETIQISWLSRLPKKPLEHNDCLYVAFLSQQRVRKPPTDNIPSQQNYFQTNCRKVIPMLLKNIGTTLGHFV